MAQCQACWLEYHEAAGLEGYGHPSHVCIAELKRQRDHYLELSIRRGFELEELYSSADKGSKHNSMNVDAPS